MPTNPEACTNGVPMELRAAISMILQRCWSDQHVFEVLLAGLPELVAVVRTSVPVTDGGNTLIALGSTGDALQQAVSRHQPTRVLVLGRGMLSVPLRPLRADTVPLSPLLTRHAWLSLGYQRVWRCATQGIVSLAWVVAERSLQRLGRPDLADRCRIAMLTTLPVQPIMRGIGTVVVEEYRRI